MFDPTWHSLGPDPDAQLLLPCRYPRLWPPPPWLRRGGEPRGDSRCQQGRLLLRLEQGPLLPRTCPAAGGASNLALGGLRVEQEEDPPLAEEARGGVRGGGELGEEGLHGDDGGHVDLDCCSVRGTRE